MAKRGAQAGRPTRQGGQVRQQVRQVRPKAAPSAQAQQPTSGKAQRRQRQQYVQSGGLLQGYAPERIVRLAYAGLAGAVLCVVIMAVIILVVPLALHDLDWPTRVAAALAWIVPIGFGASFLLPGYQLARKDLKAEPIIVQGQLQGASPVSTSFGLGMLMVKTRGGTEQLLVPSERLQRVPGNQVPVMVTLTPNLRHVRNVGIMGPRMVGRPDQPIPDIVKRMRLLPIATPVALSLGAIIGADVIAFLPIGNWLLHVILSVLVGAALAAGVYGLSFLLQRRMYAQVQTLLPGGV
jgi:hypothetical protein